MTRARLELLQWFGLLAAPFAWATQLVVGFGVTQAACSRAHIGVAMTPWELGLTVTAGVVALTAQACAVVLLRELQPVEYDARGPRGRMYFFAIAAVLGNTLFLGAIALTGAGVVDHIPCTQG